MFDAGSNSVTDSFCTLNRNIYIDMHIVDAEMKSENVEVLTEICSCTWKTLYVMWKNVCIGANAYAYGFACVGTCVCIGICVYLIALLTLRIVCAYVMVDLMSSVPYYNTCLGVSHALGVFWHLERKKRKQGQKIYSFNDPNDWNTKPRDSLHRHHFTTFTDIQQS